MYSGEHTSGLSGSAASHLSPCHSPHDKRQRLTGSWQDSERVALLIRSNFLRDPVHMEGVHA